MNRPIRSTIRVGYARNSYLEARNIVGKAQGVQYTSARDWYGLKQRVRVILRCPFDPDSEFLFHDGSLNRVDLLHLFNQVSLASTSWVATFESIVPRLSAAWQLWGGGIPGKQNSRVLERSLDAIAGGACRRLIAMSNASALMQRRFCLFLGTRAKGISEKITVLHPPQSLQPAREYRTEIRSPLRFALVGHHFFRKGGLEIVQAMEHVRASCKVDWRLTIVSRIEADEYATSSSKSDVEDAQRLLVRHGGWIDHYTECPPQQVIKILRKADVAFLPSFAETYGFSVLEAQACGTPVVTTNVRAFPEINGSECGWIVPLPLNESGDAIESSLEGRRRLRAILRDGLVDTLRSIADDPQQIEAKGRAAQDRIKLHHDPVSFAARLNEIYREALA